MAVGGTTLHYYGNSPRAHPGVFRGYDGADRNAYDRFYEFPFAYRELIPYYEWVEQTLPVQTAAMGTKEETFLDGAARMGLPVQKGPAAGPVVVLRGRRARSRTPGITVPVPVPIPPRAGRAALAGPAVLVGHASLLGPAVLVGTAPLAGPAVLVGHTSLVGSASLLGAADLAGPAAPVGLPLGSTARLRRAWSFGLAFRLTRPLRIGPAAPAGPPGPRTSPHDGECRRHG